MKTTAEAEEAARLAQWLYEQTKDFPADAAIAAMIEAIAIRVATIRNSSGPKHVAPEIAAGQLAESLYHHVLTAMERH